MAEVIRPFNDMCLDDCFPALDQIKEALKDFGLTYDMTNLSLPRGGPRTSCGQWYVWELHVFSMTEMNLAINASKIDPITAYFEAAFHSTAPTNLENLLREGFNNCVNTNDTRNNARLERGEPTGFYVEGEGRLPSMGIHVSH